MHPELRIRLHIDLEGAPELVELRDIARTEIARDGLEYLVDGNEQRLRLDAVNLHDELRHIGAERSLHALQATLRLRVADDGAGNRLQLREIERAVAQLHHHGEAACIPDALDRGRRQHGDLGFHDLVELAIERREERPQLLVLATRIPVFQDDVDDAGIGERGIVVERGDARDGERRFDAWRLAGDLGHALQGVVGAFERSAVG